MTESQYKYLDVQMLSPCRFPGWSSGSVRTVIPLTLLWPPTPTLSTSSPTGYIKILWRDENILIMQKEVSQTGTKEHSVLVQK